MLTTAEIRISRATVIAASSSPKPSPTNHPPARHLKAIPPHVPGDPGLLQVMPWSAYRHATDRFLEAIYEYLRSIPCLEGGPGTLPNRCP